MKLCRDCKFYDAYDSRCRRKIVCGTEPDTTNGGTRRVIVKSDSTYRYAREERASRLPWKCGMKARHFTPKPPL